MRQFDLAPLYRSTVGFDRLFNILDQIAGPEGAPQAYPPYNIERTGDNAYRVTLAVAGFAEKDLSIEVKDGGLVVKGSRQAEGEETRQFLHRGIAARAFERRFQLAEHVRVTGASLETGLLHIDLVREVPEAMKPRVVPIGTGTVTAAVEAPTVDVAAEPETTTH
ncbi:Hsp20 family protein [Segnochrobactraceae bacterium EtOH-i3]